jgi:hypothetical protein
MNSPEHGKSRAGRQTVGLFAATRTIRNPLTIFDGCGVMTTNTHGVRHTFVGLSPCFCTHWPWSGPIDATKANKSSCGATHMRCHHEHAVLDGSAENDHGDGGNTWTLSFAHQPEIHDQELSTVVVGRTFCQRTRYRGGPGNRSHDDSQNRAGEDEAGQFPCDPGNPSPARAATTDQSQT